MNDDTNIPGRRVQWLGAIADTTTALRASGALDGGGRVQIDVPENQMAAWVNLLTMRNKQLIITIEVVEWGKGE